MENTIDSDWGRDETGVWYTITLSRTDCLDVWRSDRIYLSAPITWAVLDPRAQPDQPLTDAQRQFISHEVQYQAKTHVRMLARALQGI